MEGMAQQIRAFVVDNLMFGRNEDPFSNDDSFVENGLIDSMGILTLVEFVKETWDIPIDDSDVVPENWDSVNRIATFVQGRLDARSSKVESAPLAGRS